MNNNRFEIGDKIVIISPEYSNDIYSNGDTGVIIDVDLYIDVESNFSCREYLISFDHLKLEDDKTKKFLWVWEREIAPISNEFYASFATYRTSYNNKSNNLIIKFAKGHESVIIPTKKYEDAGYDVYANFDETHMVIPPHQTVMIPTRLYSVVPEGYYMQLFERGSTGTRGMAQRAGVIDSGYRNEWFVPITNTTDKTIIIVKDGNFTSMYAIYQDLDYIIYPYSKAITQAVLIKVPTAKVKEISLDDLKNHKSIRGTGKIGSSGK